MNEGRQRVLVKLEDLPCLLFGEVCEEMPHGLPGKVVEQVGLLVVRHVIKVYEAPDDVIFQPAFLRSSISNRQYLAFVGSQMLNPQIR